MSGGGPIDAAARRYASSGRTAERAARSKLRLDPVYAALLARGLAAAGRVVDLGCGRGLMLSLLLEARPPGGTPPSLHGIERAPGAVRAARGALGGSAAIVEADLAGAAIPQGADAVLLLDVLHYLAESTQAEVLSRAAAALAPGGRLFIREADAAGGWRFHAVRASERAMAIARGEGLRPFVYRSAAGWRELLERRGLTVDCTPMGRGTPFANVLLEGRAPA